MACYDGHVSTGLADTLEAFRPVTPDVAGRLAGYYHPDLATRYWRSPTYLAHDGANGWAVLDGCLCLLWSKIVHNHWNLYLHHPPIHPNGDRITEGRVLAGLMAQGIGCMVSQADAERYCLPPEFLGAKPASVEIVYTGEGTPPGAKWQNARTGANRGKAAVVAGRVNVRCSATPDTKAVEDCVRVTRAWAQRDGSPAAGPYERMVRAFGAAQGGRRLATILYDDIGPFAYSLSEQIGHGQAAIIARARDYTVRTLQDPDALLHVYEREMWGGYTLNIGAGLNPDMARHKKALAPHTTVAVHKARTGVPDRSLYRPRKERAAGPPTLF